MLRFDAENVTTWTPIAVAEHIGSLKKELLFCENWLTQNNRVAGAPGRVNNHPGLTPEILNYLGTHRGGHKAKEIATAIDMPLQSVQSSLVRLKNDKRVRRTGKGLYAAVINGGTRASA